VPQARLSWPSRQLLCARSCSILYHFRDVLPQAIIWHGTKEIKPNKKKQMHTLTKKIKMMIQ